MNISDTQKISRTSRIFFWLFAILSLFLFLGYTSLWGSENRWAEITREMLLTGDYLHPAMNWRVYFDKPLLSYWAIVPFAKIFGAQSELASRIPSALAALAALYGLRAMARHLYGETVSQLASFLLLSSYGFLFWGRMAAADMANLAAVVLAVAWFFQVEKKAGFWSYFLFYVLCFMGAQFKGLGAVILPVAFLTPYLVDENRWKSHLKIANFAALLAAGILYFVPFYAASHKALVPPLVNGSAEALSGLELVWRENVLRVFQPFDHKDPFYSYLLCHLPRVLLPWTVLVLVGIAGMIRNWKSLDRASRSLLWGTLLMFVLFTLSGSRRWYYIIPLMPFVMMLGAAGFLSAGVERWNRITEKIYYYFIVVLGSLAVASMLTIPLWSHFLPFELPNLLLCALPAGGLLILCIMVSQPLPHCPGVRLCALSRGLGTVILGGSVMMLTVMTCILPSFDVMRTERAFFRHLAEKEPGLKDLPTLFWDHKADPSYLYYTGMTVPAEVASGSQQERIAVLQKFVRRNQGKRVIVFSYDKSVNLEDLGNAVKAVGCPVDVKKPSYRETRHSFESVKKKKWAVWAVDLAKETKK